MRSLKEIVEEHRDNWDKNLFDYLYDFEKIYDINYILNSDGSYKGVRLLLAKGDSNIYLDTNSLQVEGYLYGNNPVFTPLSPSAVEKIDEYYKDCFDDIVVNIIYRERR